MDVSRTDDVALELSTILEELSAVNCRKIRTPNRKLEKPPTCNQILKMNFLCSPKVEKENSNKIDPDIINEVSGLNIYSDQIIDMEEVDKITWYYPELGKFPAKKKKMRFYNKDGAQQEVSLDRIYSEVNEWDQLYQGESASAEEQDSAWPEEKQYNVKPEDEQDDTKPKKLQGDAQPEKIQDDAKPAKEQDDAKPKKMQDDAKPAKEQDDAKPEIIQNDAKPEVIQDDAKPEKEQGNSKREGDQDTANSEEDQLNGDAEYLKANSESDDLSSIYSFSDDSLSDTSEIYYDSNAAELVKSVMEGAAASVRKNSNTESLRSLEDDLDEKQIPVDSSSSEVTLNQEPSDLSIGKKKRRKRSVFKKLFSRKKKT